MPSDETSPDLPRDESYDSIDPASGALTPEAVGRRLEIIAQHGFKTLADWPAALGKHMEANPDDYTASDPEPSTEAEAEEAAEKPADGEAEPGSVQEASADGFTATVEAEAQADEQPGTG